MAEGEGSPGAPTTPTPPPATTEGAKPEGTALTPEGTKPEGLPPTVLEAKPEGEEGKPAEGEKKEGDDSAKVIDVAQIKFPEGFKGDEGTLKELATLLQDDKLAPQDRAQKLVDLHTRSLQEAANRPMQYWIEQNKTWQKEISADPDVGSGNPEKPLKAEHVAQVSKLIDQFGGQPLREALWSTGAGNNPAVVKAFVKMARLLTEGGHVTGSPPAKPKNAAEAFYPDMKQG
jgi:hypothetical protein